MKNAKDDKLIHELENLEGEYKGLVKASVNAPSMTSTLQLKRRVSEVVTRMYTIRGRIGMKRTGDWLEEIIYGAKT